MTNDFGMSNDECRMTNCGGRFAPSFVLVSGVRGKTRMSKIIRLLRYISLWLQGRKQNLKCKKELMDNSLSKRLSEANSIIRSAAGGSIDICHSKKGR